MHSGSSPAESLGTDCLEFSLDVRTACSSTLPLEARFGAFG